MYDRLEDMELHGERRLSNAIRSLRSGGVAALVFEMLGSRHHGQPSSAERRALPSMRRAVAYLRDTQTLAISRGSFDKDFEGGWPQGFTLGRNGPAIRDASPFMPAFIHHALSCVDDSKLGPLGLAADDYETILRMREKAEQYMSRFASSTVHSTPPLYSFWPPLTRKRSISSRLVAKLLELQLKNERFHGEFGPINMPFLPESWAVPPDADDTAVIYAALDGRRQPPVSGSSVDFPVEALVQFRDIGRVKRKNNPKWLAPSSGAFFTFLGEVPRNDVDLVVNANVLFVLGLKKLLNVRGVDNAVDAIRSGVVGGAFRDEPESVALYYPDNHVLHYCVSRAWRLGGVEGLGTSVERLARDLLDSVKRCGGGHSYWDRGDVDLSTALAVLTLHFAGVGSNDVRAGIKFLESRQEADGSWSAGVFFEGRFLKGQRILWSSRALTTAMALEALVRGKCGA